MGGWVGGLFGWVGGLGGWVIWVGGWVVDLPPPTPTFSRRLAACSISPRSTASQAWSGWVGGWVGGLGKWVEGEMLL